MHKMWISLFAIVALLSFSLPGGANAEDIQYVFDTPNVADGGTSRDAKAAVEKLTGVKSVSADTMKKSVTVTFDDDRVSVSEVVAALSSVGCAVSTYKKK